MLRHVWDSHVARRTAKGRMAEPEISCKLQHEMSQIQLQYANFILKHLWPTQFVLDHCLKNVTECEKEDRSGIKPKLNGHATCAG